MMQDNKIIITYDNNCEMMKIDKGEKCLFCGNYWDFKSDPFDLKNLFQLLGFQIELNYKEYQDENGIENKDW